MKHETCYPLVWPAGWERTSRRRRRRASPDKGARPTLLGALVQLQRLAERFELGDLIVSMNVETNRYGEPIDGRGDATDPGIAVYFTVGATACVLACDRWQQAADNLAGIAQHMRALCHGAVHLGVGSLERAFAAYAGAPPPRPQRSPSGWRRVMGISDAEPVTTDRIETLYRALARKLHPDLPAGSHVAMTELNLAREAALRELGLPAWRP